MAVQSLRDALRAARESKDSVQIRRLESIVNQKIESTADAYTRGAVSIFELVATFEAVMNLTVGI